MSPIWLIVCASSLSAAPGVVSDPSPDEAVVTALNLSTEYNRAVRPPPDNGMANTINVYGYLNNLLSVDSTAQEVTLKIWLVVQWTDSRLSWLGNFNSSLDSVDSIILPGSLPWQPDISFNEALELTEKPDDKERLTVLNTGVVQKSTAVIVKFKCQMQMTKFPFDTQTCSLKVFSSMLNANKGILVNKSFLDNTPDGIFVVRSNEFCIIGTSFIIKKTSGYDVPELQVQFQRMSTFYVVNLILPSLLLLAISALAFRLPPECGERVSFSITIVLSMCVFLQLAGNYTPTQSESVPLITCYYSVAVLMTMTNVLCNAFVLNCHFKQHGCSRVGNRLIRALFLNRFVSGRSSQQQVAAAAAAAAANDNEWQAVVTSADKVFFTAFVSVTAALTAGFLITQAAEYRSSCLGSSSF